MCDILVLERGSSWPRRYECERSGKYETNVVKYRPHWDLSEEPLEHFTIHVCKQHLNAFGRGASLQISTGAGKERKQITVVGQPTERGQLENEVRKLRDLRDSAHNRADQLHLSMGRQIARHAVILADALKDVPEAEELLILIESYKHYRNKEDQHTQELFVALNKLELLKD